MSTEVFHGLEEQGVETFIDDGIGHETDFDPLLVLFEEVFKRLIFWNLRLNGPKRYFGGYKAEFLGHLVDGQGHKHLSRRVTAILEMVHPHNKKQVKVLMGGLNYFRDYAGMTFSNITAPITKLLQNEVLFEWSAECDKNFKKEN